MEAQAVSGQSIFWLIVIFTILGMIGALN